MAYRGVSRGLEMMRRWSGGAVCQGLVDNYPLPPVDPLVEVSPVQVKRWLGIDLSTGEIAEILRRLEFKVEIRDGLVHATTPDHRLDIGTGIVGVADLMEEIARIYGYERIPEMHMADELPLQRGNPALESDEKVRDLLGDLGLQEVVNYRMTSPEREARSLPDMAAADLERYVKIANPIASDRHVLRRSLLPGLLEVAEHNARLRERIAIFEIGPVFNASPGGDLPDEVERLAIAMTGRRSPQSWQGSDSAALDFYDLKGILSELFAGLHIGELRFAPGEHASMHPGKCARITVGETELGVMGELHPLVHEHYELTEAPLLAADLDLRAIRENIPARFTIKPVPVYPPVLEDLAVTVDESVPAERVEAVIRSAGGKILSDLRLFDVYRGEQIGAEKKSLAYSLTYQSVERTLTDEEVLKIRQRIVHELGKELQARLRQ